MRAWATWFLASWCSASSLRADPMEEAQKLFAVGRPAEAAALLGKAAADGKAGPDAWFNLGQACSASGEPGKALWAWRQGLRSAPRDGGLRTAAAEARRRTGGTGAHPLALLTGWLRPEEWASGLLGATAGIAAWMLAIRAEQGRRRQGLAWLAGLQAIMAAGWLGSMLGTAWSPNAVVVVRQAEVALAPVPEAKPVVTLPEATEVRVLRTFREWSEVEQDGRRLGWLRSDHLMRDVR